jgi:DNA replication and repair protein RecF
MLIRRLQVNNVRNLSRIGIDSFKSVNVFFGSNGSGKTSLLEAVHFLLMGRSFRHSQFKPLLKDGEDESIVFAELTDEDARRVSLGVSRKREGKPTIRLDGAKLPTLAELIQLAPVQVLNNDTFEMLVGGPSHRREFLDWGLFHVEPRFFPVWRLAQRALKQRNSLIRHGKIDRSQMELWSREYARYGEELGELRADYFSRLLPRCHSMLSDLSPVVAKDLDVTYSKGWAKDQSLEALLLDGIERDVQQGFTRIGPHRADLRVLAGASAAADVLSRGQLKIAVAAFYLAQAQLVRESTGKKSIFLVDDLPAELDREHRRRFCAQLERLDLQVFVTCIDRADLIECWREPESVALFHVEQGCISPLSNSDLQDAI